MSAPRQDVPDRPVRVSVPVRVSFATATFVIHELTADLSVGGLFLVTETVVEPGVEGQLTFRVSPWDHPFTVRAVVVRVVTSTDTAGQRPGLGIQFVELGAAERRELERLLAGIQNGSVVDAIRRSLRQGGRDLLEEIRSRPVDQRLMLALQASEREIDALVRDGHPAVVERLLDNPRINVRQMRAISADPRLPTRALTALRRQERWFADEEVRRSYCAHPAAPLADVLRTLALLTTASLRKVAADPTVRGAVRSEARALVGRR